MSHYTMLSKYGNYMRLLKIKNKLKIGCFTNEVAKNSGYTCTCGIIVNYSKHVELFEYSNLGSFTATATRTSKKQ